MKPVIAQIVDGLTTTENDEMIGILDSLAELTDATPNPEPGTVAGIINGASARVRAKFMAISEAISLPEEPFRWGEQRYGLPAPTPQTPNDCVYVWRAEGIAFEGLQVFKIGVTTSHLGRSRIDGVARKAGFTPADILICQTDEPKLVEKTLLGMMPVIPKLGIADGKTEFRAATAEIFHHIRNFLSILGNPITHKDNQK